MRRRGYALIYLLAALPLIMIVGNISVQICGRALRAQRIAVAEHTDDITREIVLTCLRTDALAASRVEEIAGTSGFELVLSAGEWSTRWRGDGHTLTRIEQKDGIDSTPQDWHLRHGTCGLQVERLAGGRQLVWLQCVQTLPYEPRLATTRRYVTAVVVGDGAQP